MCVNLFYAKKSKDEQKHFIFKHKLRETPTHKPYVYVLIVFTVPNSRKS